MICGSCIVSMCGSQVCQFWVKMKQYMNVRGRCPSRRLAFGPKSETPNSPNYESKRPLQCLSKHGFQKLNKEVLATNYTWALHFVNVTVETQHHVLLPHCQQQLTACWQFANFIFWEIEASVHFCLFLNFVPRQIQYVQNLLEPNVVSRVKSLSYFLLNIFDGLATYVFMSGKFYDESP